MAEELRGYRYPEPEEKRQHKFIMGSVSYAFWKMLFPFQGHNSEDTISDSTIVEFAMIDDDDDDDDDDNDGISAIM